MNIASLSDGPIQKQMLLMKLQHEFNSRPDFGANFDNNPDGVVRRWLARTGAIMNRIGISEDISFKSSIRNSGRFWVASMQSVQVAVLEAIEKLKLELDLQQQDDVGHIYDANQRYEFARDLTAILSEVKHEVFVVDPYFDEAILDFVADVKVDVDVKVLLGKGVQRVSELAKRLERDRETRVEIRKSTKIHDRVIFCDETIGWMVGASLKDAGGKPTYLMPIPAGLVPQKHLIYRKLWDDTAS